MRLCCVLFFPSMPDSGCTLPTFHRKGMDQQQKHFRWKSSIFYDASEYGHAACLTAFPPYPKLKEKGPRFRIFKTIALFLV